MKRPVGLHQISTTGADGLNDTPRFNPTTGRLEYSPGGGGGGSGGGGMVVLAPNASVPADTPAGTVAFRRQPTPSEVQTAIAADTPAVHLSLDETTGDWLDVSGNARHFTPGAGVSRGLASIISDSGFAAAGSGSAPIGSRGSNAGLTAASSMEFAISIPATTIKGNIVKIGTANNGWAVAVGNGNDNSLGRQLVIVRSGLAYVSTGYTFPAGAGKYRIIATYDGAGTFAAYVDGTQVFIGNAGSINAPGAGLMIGSDNGVHLSAGVPIDDVAFYAGALSATRAASHGGYANSGRASGWWDGTRLLPLA